jgi:hypothetical protein
MRANKLMDADVLSAAFRPPIIFTLDRMFRVLLRLPAVSFLALIGDPGHLSRVWLCLLAGVGATVGLYWLSPAVLPLWPGLATIAAAAAIGGFWEWRAQKAAERILP